MSLSPKNAHVAVSILGVKGHISWESAAQPSSWDKGCPDKHHIGNV